MKLLLFVISLAFLIAVQASAAIEPASDGNSTSKLTESSSLKPKFYQCPGLCTELFNPICAKNRRCIALFGNPCKFDRYNCNTERWDQFFPTDDWACKTLDAVNNIRCR